MKGAMQGSGACAYNPDWGTEQEKTQIG